MALFKFGKRPAQRAQSASRQNHARHPPPPVQTRRDFEFHGVRALGGHKVRLDRRAGFQAEGTVDRGQKQIPVPVIQKVTDLAANQLIDLKPNGGTKRGAGIGDATIPPCHHKEIADRCHDGRQKRPQLHQLGVAGFELFLVADEFGIGLVDGIEHVDPGVFAEFGYLVCHHQCDPSCVSLSPGPSLRHYRQKAKCLVTLEAGL